jgi:hypothetical protein
MTQNPVSVEFNLANSIEVTPRLREILILALDLLKTEREKFVCHAVDTEVDGAPVRRFIMASIQSGEFRCSTLTDWIYAVYPSFLDGGVRHDILMRNVREAWVEKMLYLIDVKDAVRLYSDGSYLDADWRYLPNGEPGWMLQKGMIGCAECTDEPECAWHQKCARK